MNILTFTYTKADQSVSERVLVVSAEPTRTYKGTDISSLSQERQAEYIRQVSAAKEEYLEYIKGLNNDFDLNFNFRQFDPAKMTNIVQEDI